MKVVALCVLTAAVLARSTAGELLPPQASYKILMLLPVSTKSHRNVFMSVAEALADRGHKVVMLTNHPKSSNHPNITEVTHGLRQLVLEDTNMFNHRRTQDHLRWSIELLPNIARELYKVAEVKSLYDRRREFDLMMVNQVHNEVAYPFLHGVPFITVAPAGVYPSGSAVLGNVLNPSYAPNFVTAYASPMSAWERFRSTVEVIAVAWYRRKWAVVPRVQEQISIHFPELPPLLEIEKNQSLALLNSHFSISMALPLLPSQVEVGAMHCRPSKPLPEELESWLTGAGSAGVIYFNLGSIVLGNSMPVEYRNMFIEAFRKLPQRVLWKYEGELEVPDNVMTNKWIPQQDVLAHDSVKVFITHGGLLSLQEAIYHVTPLIVLPIFGDQPKNGLFVKTSGLGLMLEWEELTTDVILSALTEVLSDTKYKKKVVQLSTQLQDQLVPPLERAVFWAEYVIRHRGAPHLRSPAAHLSWLEFLMLDVLVLLLMAGLVFLYILQRIVRAISTMVCNGDDASDGGSVSEHNTDCSAQRKEQ